MRSICETQFPTCEKSSECMVTEAIHSLNNVLLSTIEEIDENKIGYSTDISTRWKNVARTINHAYNSVLEQNLKYSDISSDISQILDGELILEKDKVPNQYEIYQSEVLYNELEEKEHTAAIAEEISSKVSEQNTQEVPRSASAFKNANDSQQKIVSFSLHNLSTENLDLLDNYKQLEVTTNKLIEEYLHMHKKTLSFIKNQNSSLSLNKIDMSLDIEVDDLIKQLTQSITEFSGTETMLVNTTKSPIMQQTQNNFSNTDAQIYALNCKKSASVTNLPNQSSSESLTIKTPSTEFSINLYEKNENVVQEVREVVEDFHGYMRKIHQRIDRTKRDFDILRTMLEGTILDCENTIVEANRSKVKSIRSSYNMRINRSYK